MARTATNPAAILPLLAALSALAGCGTAEPSTASTSDRLPAFGWQPSRMREPSSERPPWLPSVPADPQRLPAQADGFRA